MPSEHPCSLADVLPLVTARINELMTNLLRFTATEEVEHFEARNSGGWSKPVRIRFDYMAEIERYSNGLPHMRETRDGGLSWEKFPAGLATLGIPSTILVLDPYFSDGYQLTCEGSGEWAGRPAWLLYFQQRSDKHPRLRGYVANHREWLLNMKGRVWIDKESFNPMHVETDLAEPVPQILLFRDHMAIDYEPVHFARQAETLWLPRRAEVFTDFKGHRFRRVHTFSNFLLFSVDVNTKDKPPVQP